LKKIPDFNRWLHTFVGMLAALLLLFYGSSGFMLNHKGWFKKPMDLPVVKGKLKNLSLMADTDKNKEAIAAELRDQFQIKEKFKNAWWNGNHYTLYFSELATKTDVDISKDGRLEIKAHRLGLARILMELHQGGPGGGYWHWMLDAASIGLLLLSLSGLVMWTGLAQRRRLGLLALGLSVAAITLVLVLL
jgi:hypothetical protein